jgi:putative Mg2+ transporter-C (MgtC) family protein
MDTEILLRFFLAALWGGLVGAEREYRSKSAGFRTMIMISIGACFFTMMSVRIGTGSNPDRIASNIVTGIGFLGAGVIFHGQNRINGITTAATIWTVAAVGMGIGGGYYFASACACLLVLLVLAILPYVERMIDRLNKSRDYTITCDYSEPAQQNFEALLKKNRLRFRVIEYSREANNLSITWETQGHLKNHDAFIRAICDDPSIRRFDY